MAKNIRPYGKSGTRNAHFVLLYDELLNSPAYRSLSCQAKCVLIRIKQRFFGHNNGQISLSCRDCAKLDKISKDTAQRAFLELEEKGFIEIITKGMFGTRMASTFRLTMDTNTGSKEMPTNEWKKWGQKPVLKESHPILNEGQACPQNRTEEKKSVTY
ncbi:hypothetical protein LJC18_04645 [Lachnospiraceae bacterium OttesenSCG-928-E19]|nr:hypothetical protein [Lachnospiraceae bacterium OttesenSCG-928-E19]